MTDLHLDKDFQPSLKENSDLRVKYNDKEVEQRVRLALTDRLFEVISNYSSNEAMLKIRLEVNRIARESSFIESVENITINRKNKQDSASYYEVLISFQSIENFSLELDNL